VMGWWPAQTEDERMKIRELSWENYRRLPDGQIEVRNHLVLVGPNDSGKSSVLRAINICLGVPGAQLGASVEPGDFTDPNKHVVLRVVLVDFNDDDRAAFPDEISTVDGESLTVEVEAFMDGDAEQKQVRRRFPFSGHTRSASRIQMDRFGWAYVSAARSLYRELGAGASSVVRTLLSTVDLEGDQAVFDTAADAFREALENAEALTTFRTDLADALSGALPRTVAVDDLALMSEADLAGDPLSGVTITLADGEHRSPLAEQSDGIRALSVLTLLGE
jgi:putative ATP-dependent endonuclease of OLD family